MVQKDWTVNPALRLRRFESYLTHHLFKIISMTINQKNLRIKNLIENRGMTSIKLIARKIGYGDPPSQDGIDRVLDAIDSLGFEEKDGEIILPDFSQLSGSPGVPLTPQASEELPQEQQPCE